MPELLAGQGEGGQGLRRRRARSQRVDAPRTVKGGRLGGGVGGGSGVRGVGVMALSGLVILRPWICNSQLGRPCHLACRWVPVSRSVTSPACRQKSTGDEIKGVWEGGRRPQWGGYRIGQWSRVGLRVRVLGNVGLCLSGTGLAPSHTSTWDLV